MTRPTALPVNVAGTPDVLKAQRRWVCWRYEWQQHDGKKGRWAKILCTTEGRHAKSNDASTWTTFDDAVAASGRFDGVGFCLGDGWAGTLGARRPHVHALPGSLSCCPRAPLRGTMAQSVAESIVVMPREPLTSLAAIPRVCFVEDLARIFRMPLSSLKSRQKYGYGYFPLLPPIDRRARVSGAFVQWFLTENRYWVERYKEILENATKTHRQRRVQWYELGPPYTQPLIGAARSKEVAAIRLREMAEILRVSPGALRKAARRLAFACPPKDLKPLAWTGEQLARLLAPPDIRALERQARREQERQSAPEANS